jgi:flagellar basal body P-ring formation protein FlgA
MKAIRQISRKQLVVVSFALTLVTMQFGREADAADIALRATAMPTGTVVRLGDVADVSAESKQEAQRLAATPLMPTPAPDTERFLRMREIQDLLAAHGENMDQLRFKGELMVSIGSHDTEAPATKGPATSDVHSTRREAWSSGSATAATSAAAADTNVGPQRDALNRRVVEYLNQNSGQTAAWNVALNVPSQQLASLPADPATWTVSGGASPWTGKQRLMVSFAGAHGTDSFTVPADISLPTPVVVAIRPLDRGSVITAADVELQQRDMSGAAAGRVLPVSSVEKIVGMEATRTIQPGNVVMADAVQPPVLVKRGDSVTVFARGGGIQVRTIARARENGSLGQPVQVESLDSHKPYDAVVTGMREAVVFAGSSPAPTETANARGSVSRR